MRDTTTGTLRTIEYRNYPARVPEYSWAMLRFSHLVRSRWEGSIRAGRAPSADRLNRYLAYDFRR